MKQELINYLKDKEITNLEDLASFGTHYLKSKLGLLSASYQLMNHEGYVNFTFSYSGLNPEVCTISLNELS
jgi:hypothetical protein